MPVWEDEGDEETKNQTPKQRLLGWIQNKIPYLPITNFHQNWQDGKALGALVDSCAPGKFYLVRIICHLRVWRWQIVPLLVILLILQ